MPDRTFVLRSAESNFRLSEHVAERVAIRWSDLLDTVRASAKQDTAGTSRRSVWALMDQGIVSLGNCATNVLLARSIAVAQFGLFMILLEVMLFLNSLQSALIIYPLSVRGAVVDKIGLKRLAGACLMLTGILAIPLGLTVMIAGGVVGSLTVGILATIALLLWQCQEMLRRALMAHGRQRDTIAGDIVSYIGQATIIFIISRGGSLTVNAAFATMAFTSAAAVLVQCWQIGPTFKLTSMDLARTAWDFWRLGRWVLLGNLTLIVSTLGCSWVLKFCHGLDSVGQFAAMGTLMKLSNPLTICMAGLILPAAARAFRTEGIDAARSVAIKYGLMTIAVIAPYFGFLFFLPTTAIHLVYGATSAYGDLGGVLRAFVLWYSALLIAQIGGCLLNAIEQGRRSFIAQVAQTLAVLVIALPLTAIYGLNGLMLGGVIGNCVMAACYISMVRRLDEPLHTFHSRRIVEEMQASSKLAA